MLELKNPHSVLAVLKKRPKDVVEIAIMGLAGGVWDEVVSLAKSKRVPVLSAAPDRGRGPGPGGKVERIGIAVARVREPLPVPVESLFTGANEPGASGLWLALDCLQDPHNVGAIFRSAGFFGVRGIIMTKDRSASITGTVCDVAAGGVESVPFAEVTNLKRTMEQAKAAGLWLLGTSEHAKDRLESYSADRPWLLVLGNEEKGLRQGTLEGCDCVCGIHPSGSVTSLNVSVATGICISWLSRKLSS